MAHRDHELNAGVDRLHLRAALGRFATGVAIVTTAENDGVRIGLTINSFNSVSLDPPLVLWSLANHSPNLASFRSAGGFAINVLNHQQSALAMQFARPVADRFADVVADAGLKGMPLLRGALATFECHTHEIVAGGDHTIFIGRVLRARQIEGRPLLFYGGRFAEMNAEPAGLAQHCG